MAGKASFSESLRYRTDNFLAKGSGALFISLTVAFMLTLCGIGLFRFVLQIVYAGLGAAGIAEGESYGIWGFVSLALHYVWYTFLQLTDPGNMAQDNDTWMPYKVSAVLAGMAGVVIFSALIAFLTTALDQAIASLKKGRSRVLEKEHTLIIGWGPRVLEILRELVEANESEKDPVVAILAEVDKEEMDDYLRERHTDRRNTRIVTRSGPTSSLASLEKVRADEARSAIVLATCGEAGSAEDKLASDARVIKTVLALVSQVGEDHEINIVAEIFDPRNRDVVKSISPDRISVIDAQDILAKIMVQTSRTSGLSVVYAELLSFEGCEMYFYDADWNGITFGHVQFHFPDGVPIGIRTAAGELTIRPPIQTVLEDGDEVLIIADDDSTIDFRPNPLVTPQEMSLRPGRIQPREEKMLVLGWSPKASVVIGEYADYVLDGSRVDVMISGASPKTLAEIGTLNQEMDGLSIGHIDMDPMSSADLASVFPFSYNTVLVLPQNPDMEVSPERVDSETIIVLLHLRKLLKEAQQQYEQEISTKLITEVLDSANQELISRAGVNDFIISNRMVSMMFAQISEEPDIQRVYDDLFQEDGSEIYVKPAWLYFEQLPVTCTFGDLMKLVQKRDEEICIGYKLKELETDGDENYGVKLIPFKDTEVTLGAEDGLVVVAEDDM